MMRKFHRERNETGADFSSGTLFFKNTNKQMINIYKCSCFIDFPLKNCYTYNVYIEYNGGARHVVSRRCRDAMGR